MSRTLSCRSAQRGTIIGIPVLFSVLLLRLRVWFRGLALLEALLKVPDDVVNVLGTDRDADQVLRDAAVGFLRVGQLLVGRGPGVDGQGFGIADAVRVLALLCVSCGRWIGAVGGPTWLDLR